MEIAVRDQAPKRDQDQSGQIKESKRSERWEHTDIIHKATSDVYLFLPFLYNTDKLLFGKLDHPIS